jgi:hypothetical protein
VIFDKTAAWHGLSSVFSWCEERGARYDRERRGKEGVEVESERRFRYFAYELRLADG